MYILIVLFQILNYFHYIVKKRPDWKASAILKKNKGDEMLTLRQNLEEVLSVGDDGMIKLQEVFNLLVPFKYKKTHLHDLLIKASGMGDWFVKTDGEDLFVNFNNINLERDD